MGTKANILVVEVGPKDYDHVAPQLLQALFEVDRVPSADAALELLRMVPFSAVICRHPLVSSSTEDFIDAVKGSDSASREAGIAIVTDPERMAETGALLDKGADLVLSLADPQGEREALLCTLLGIQPRRSLRVLVKLSVALDPDMTDRFVSQTHDISGSGMFVITRKHIAVGTSVGFHFVLPGESRPFEGTATVTRIAEDSGKGPAGLGVQFESFGDPDGPERLIAKLDQIARGRS